MTRSAIKDFRKAGQATRSEMHRGTVTINGRRYQADVLLGSVERIPTEGGVARGQKLRADISKALMSSPPAQKSLVTHEGVEFKVQEIGGRNATDVAWVLRCVRWIE